MTSYRYPGEEAVLAVTALVILAVLLLTAHFSKLAPSDPKPLTPTEWGRFARWLPAIREKLDIRQLVERSLETERLPGPGRLFENPAERLPQAGNG